MENKLQQNIEAFKLDEVLGYVVNRAALVMRKKLTQLFSDAGHAITYEEFTLLSRLWEEDGILQTELTEKTYKDKTRVTRLVGGLVEKSLLAKEISRDDRRNFQIQLTEKGKELKYQLLPLVFTVLETASTNISKPDMETTIKTLKSVIENVNRTI